MKIKYAKALRSIAKIALLLCLLSLLGLGIFFTYKSVKFKPYKVRVSNVTDSAFTVSWVTEEPMVGVVYYGEKDSFLPGPLAWIGKQKAVDDRDYSNAQTECVSEFNKKASKNRDENFTVDIEGYDCTNVKVTKRGQYYTHHITVQNLEAEKEYFFRVGDGYISYVKGKTDGVEYIEREMSAVEVFSQKTLPVINDVSSPNPAYGTSYNLFYSKDGQVGMKKNFDAIIFLKTFKEGVEYPLMSAVSNNDGGWSIDYANVRDFEGKTLGMENTYVEFIPQVENARPGASGTSRFEDTEYPLNLMGNNMDELKEQQSASAESVSYIKNIFVRGVHAQTCYTLKDAKSACLDGYQKQGMKCCPNPTPKPTPAPTPAPTPTPSGDTSKCYCVSQNCASVKKALCSGSCIGDRLTCQGELEDKTSGTQVPMNCCTYNSTTNSCGTCNKPCTGSNLTKSACDKKVVEGSDKGTKTCCKASIGNDLKPACDCETLQKSCSGEYKEYTSKQACISAHVVTTGTCKSNGCRDCYLTSKGSNVNVPVRASKSSIFPRLLGFRSYAALPYVLQMIDGQVCNGNCNSSGNEDIRDDDDCSTRKEDCVQWFSKKDCSYVFKSKSVRSLDGYTKNQAECGENLIKEWRTCTSSDSNKTVEELYNDCKGKLGEGNIETSEADIKKIITNCVQTGATAKIVSGGCESPCYIQYTKNGDTCGAIALPSGSAFCSNPYCPQQDRVELKYEGSETSKECPGNLRGGCLCPKDSVQNFVKNGENCEKKKVVFPLRSCTIKCGEEYASCTCPSSCVNSTAEVGKTCGGDNSQEIEICTAKIKNAKVVCEDSKGKTCSSCSGSPLSNYVGKGVLVEGECTEKLGCLCDPGGNYEFFAVNEGESCSRNDYGKCGKDEEFCYRALGNNGLTCEGKCVKKGTCSADYSSLTLSVCEAKNHMIYTCYQKGSSTCNPLPGKWSKCRPEEGIHYTKDACENVENGKYYHFSNIYNDCLKASQSQCSSGADTNCYYQDPTCGGRAGCYYIDAKENDCKQVYTAGSCIGYEQTLSDCLNKKNLKEQGNQKVCCEYTTSHQANQSSYITTYTYYEMKSPAACTSTSQGVIVDNMAANECTSINFQDIKDYPLGSNLTGTNKFSCCSSGARLTLVAGDSCPDSNSSRVDFSFCEALGRRFVYCLDRGSNQVLSYSYLGDKGEAPKCPDGQEKVERRDWKTDDGEYCCVNRKLKKEGCNFISVSETAQVFPECSTYEGELSPTDQTSLPKIQENTKASLISKTYAQTNDSSIIFFPETGAYEIEEEGEKRYVVGEKDQSQIVYIERNGIPGFQSPKDLSTPKEDEDLLVDASAFVTSVTQLSSGKIIELKEGVNIISFNLFPTDGTESNQLTSKQFLELVNQTGRNVSRIAYFSAGQWNGGTSFDFSTFETKGVEFVLSPGTGYVVVAEKDVKIVVPGYTSESPVPIAFSSGWNLVGVHGYDTQYTANSLINSINTIQGLKSNNVTYWPTSKGMYQGYQLSEGQAYGQDFPISKDLGYFVRISEFNAPDTTCKSIIWNPGGSLNGKCGSNN